MDRTAALTLAGKVEATWFNRLPPAQLDVWIDALTDLDEGAAGTAYARLRGREPSMTIARFCTEVRSIRTTDGGTERRPPCGACGDSGWLETEDHIEPGGPLVNIAAKLAPDGTVIEPARTEQRAIVYTQVKPCACREGRARAESSVWRERGAA